MPCPWTLPPWIAQAALFTRVGCSLNKMLLRGVGGLEFSLHIPVWEGWVGRGSAPCRASGQPSSAGGSPHVWCQQCPSPSPVRQGLPEDSTEDQGPPCVPPQGHRGPEVVPRVRCRVLDKGACCLGEEVYLTGGLPGLRKALQQNLQRGGGGPTA